ncbi:hypothetical protein N9L02_02020 [Gammaproteobacteria bacterium]|nr:hypothetical protein [Gammaproteobacteria bacterium]
MNFLNVFATDMSLVEEYTPPQLDSLNFSSTKIRNEYTGTNASRLELISLIEDTHKYKLNSINVKNSDNMSIYLGCWIYCFEKINCEYNINPSFSNGYFFNSGSKLYTILEKHLNIDKYNKITNATKLKYISKYYNFICTKKTLIILMSKKI